MHTIPRPEYPRPQFVRDAWRCLNGPWEFAFDQGDSGEARGMAAPGAEYPLQITVPFCPESALSGIGHVDFIRAVWYRRSLRLDEGRCAGRVFLRFGAVDYLAGVWVNGEKCGSHAGGYSSFGVEITDFVRPGENIVVVRAQDDVHSPEQPGGKQCPDYHSRRCHYTRTTGIWQSVWLEFTPRAYLEAVRILPDDRNGSVSFTARAKGTDGAVLKTKITFNGQTVGEAAVQIGGAPVTYTVPVSQVRLWGPGHPDLYEVEYELDAGDGGRDAVASYFGFSRVEIKRNQFLLNGKKVFQRLVLDQGFYPDGIYTAPTDEALRRDIELSIEAGFNGARLHQKIFEERFLYWADRLGYLVWGEHASWGVDISNGNGALGFLPEWLEAVERDANHPSIIGWCPFNETRTTQDKRVLQLAYQATRAADPTRPVIDTSGYQHVVTDVYDVHDYDQNTDSFRARYVDLAGPDFDKINRGYASYGGQPFFVSEFGGTWWAPGRADGWGYGNAPGTEEAFTARVEGLFAALLENPAICGYCYTQLTDVEQEQNGIYTYQRGMKIAPENFARIAAANRAPAAYEG